MKPFNIDLALQGEPVITRDGRKVTYITKIPNHNFIVGIIEGIPQITQWAVNGNFLNDHYTHLCDLFMFIEKKSVWVNVYESEDNTDEFQVYTSRLHPTKESALAHRKDYNYIKTIEITNEI